MRDERLHGEKGGVVQRLEINGSVNRPARMMEIVTHGQLNFRAAFFGDAETRPEPLVDRCAVIHRDERLEVCAFHVVRFG